MARRWLSACTRVAVFTGLLSAGAFVGSGCAQSNQEACESYVSRANIEYTECGYRHLELDARETCPDFINLGGADCTEYYDCLEERVICCTPQEQAADEAAGRTPCELWSIDFAAMEACTGCR